VTRKRILAATLVVATAVGGYFAWKHYDRLRAGADVTRYVPANAQTLFWVPRLDQAAEALSRFTRGINEAARLREYLKAETGADLGSAEGLRQVGVDPEAGMAIYSQGPLIHLLFGVEDPLKLSRAIAAKFVNLGYPPPANAENEDTTQIRTVKDAEGRVYAAYAARDGLMAVVYSVSDADPTEGLKGVFDTSGDRFFDSETYKAAEKKVPGEGPLIFLEGAAIATQPDGKSRAEVLNALGLPGVVDAFVRPSVEDYLKRLRYVAARLDVSPCATSVNVVLDVEGDARLLPATWLLPDSSQSPDFGQMMPRDTVMMMRLGPAGSPIWGTCWAWEARSSIPSPASWADRCTRTWRTATSSRTWWIT
jgi:hypothetical protein